jgi:AraC-like DNA-binding protein
MTAALSPLSWFFLFACALNGLVAIAILLVMNKTMRVANFLLAINLLGISAVSVTISLVESKLILAVPHFYRLPSPVYYLMFPAAYLYVKLILKDRTRLERKDYLHFLPAFIHLVEMTPFYLLSAEEKVNNILQAFSQDIEIYAHSEGWLPPYLHNIIRGCMAVIYAIAMWRLIRNSIKETVNNYATSITHWLKTITVLNALIGIGAIVFLTALFIPAEVRSYGFHLIFLIVLLVVNFHLFFRPEILYGLPQPVLAGNDPLDNTPVEKPLKAAEYKAEIPAFIYNYKSQIHQYLTESKRYLEPNFMLQDLSRDTGIPQHHLQLLIHKVEEKKFSEFINDYRIQHLQDQIERGGMKNKTLEGLAAESGFSSKATFIRSVKKRTGRTPKDYFNQGKTSA